MKLENIPLSKYSLEQKLLLMEKLWAELAGSEGAFLSPPWHRDILKDREMAYQSGKMKASSWEKAKKRIRKQLP